MGTCTCIFHFLSENIKPQQPETIDKKKQKKRNLRTECRSWEEVQQQSVRDNKSPSQSKLSEVCNGSLSVIVFFNLLFFVKESEDFERLGCWAFGFVLGPKSPTSNVRIEIIDEIDDVGQRKITFREQVGPMILARPLLIS